MRTFVAFVVLLTVAHASFAEVLVLKNGKKFEVSSYEVKGNYVVFQDSKGNPVQLPLATVDLAKSREVTKALANKRDAEKARLAALEAEREKMRQKQTHNMEDLVNFVEGSKKGDRSVTLTNDGLSDHNGQNQGTVGMVQTTSASSGSDGGTKGSAQGASARGDDVDGRYQHYADEYHDKKAKLDALESQIKEAERVAELNESAAANNDENHSGYFPQDGDDKDGEGSAYINQADKARERAEELRKERDELSGSLDDLKRNARSEGIRNYERMETTSAKEAAQEKRANRGQKGDRDPSKGQSRPDNNYAREDLRNRGDDLSYREEEESEEEPPLF